MKLLYQDLTYKIRGACYEVYKEFGGAFKEKVIQNALVKALEEKGLKIESQHRIELYFKGEKVGVYIPDIIVENKILIELKTQPLLVKRDRQQFWSYLRGSDYKVGLLINFGNKLEIIRRVYDTARYKSSA